MVQGENFLEAIEDYSFVELNEDGLVQYCNKATYAMTGFTTDDLQGNSFSLLYTNEDALRKQFEEDLLKAADNGHFSTNAWKLRKDGTRFWTTLSFDRLSDGHPGKIAYGVVMTNTTVSKETELHLKKSEELYRMMVEGVLEYSIYMLDASGIILTWNEGGERIKGYRASEIIGRHFSIFYTAQDIDAGKPEDVLKIAIATGKYEEEGWRVRKDGSLFWAALVITALYDPNNEFIGFCKVTRDLSEKRKAEELLHASEHRYRLFIEQVKDYGMFMLDEKGKIASWNAGAKSMTGYTADEVLGKYFSIFYLEQDRYNDKPGQELKEALEQGKFEEEGWRVQKDGSVHWTSVTITAIYNTNNVLEGFAKVVRDLTERKETENFLRENNKLYKAMANVNRIFIQQSPHAIAMFDMDMRYMAASAKWITDYKLERTNIVGASHYEIFPELSEHARNIIREGLLGNCQSSAGSLFMRADGSTQLISWDVRPWHTIEGDIGGLLMYTSDDTNMSKMEVN